MSESPASQPLPAIGQVQVKFTNNCNRIGDLMCQIANMQAAVAQLVKENSELQVKYNELKAKEKSDASPAAAE